MTPRVPVAFTPIRSLSDRRKVAYYSLPVTDRLRGAVSRWVKVPPLRTGADHANAERMIAERGEVWTASVYTREDPRFGGWWKAYLTVHPTRAAAERAVRDEIDRRLAECLT